MAASGLKDIVPYAVNFSIVVVLLTIIARKPLKRFVFQRHERLKDFVDASSKTFKAAKARYESASMKLGGVEAESKEILSSEMNSARKEAVEIISKGKEEAERMRKEAERLIAVEQSDVELRIKVDFLDNILAAAETRLKRGLKNDDHKKILKNAESRIGVGQNG